MAESLPLAEGPEACSPSVAASEETLNSDIFFVKLQFKGGTYEVPVETGDAISSIFDFVLEVPEMHDFPRENCKLICKGKVFRPDDIVRSDGDFKLSPGAKLMLMATSAHDSTFVRNNRADPLVKGFKEEERDEKSRQKRARAAAISAWGTKQDLKYRFNSIKAEFKYSSPSPYDAEKLLQKLATDPGIIDIMKSRSFEVGILTEMSPAEAQDRMAKKGTPGMDLLGYNQNSGEMIVLRLRTDNTKGFRPYHDLINTLIHELTHNVISPHDASFWKLFGELKAQYMKFHRFWSHGGRAADSNASGQFQGFAGDEEAAEDFGHVLGSASSSAEAPQTEAQRRERATLAAEARKVTATTGINFLSLNGKTVIVCPCGQTHDPGDCPMNLPEQEAAMETSDMDIDQPSRQEVESSSGADVTGFASAEPVHIPDEDMAAPAPNMQQQADNSMNAPEPNTMEPTQMPDADMIAALPTVQTEKAGGAQQPQPQPEFDCGAHDASPDVGLFAGLSAEDLEALGLGGAAEWLQSFSEKLEALTSHTAQSQARQAIELLLKLVHNIVTSPREAKFRRIKADNPKIRAGLLAAGVEVEKMITLLGFEDATEDGGRVFVLRDATFDNARLQMGQDMLQRQLRLVTPS